MGNQATRLPNKFFQVLFVFIASNHNFGGVDIQLNLCIMKKELCSPTRMFCSLDYCVLKHLTNISKVYYTQLKHLLDSNKLAPPIFKYLIIHSFNI